MDRRGFTSVEMLIASIIMLIAVLACTSSFSSMFRGFSFIRDAASLELEAKVLGRQISGDLRRTARYAITIEKNSPVNGSDGAVFYLPGMMDSDDDGIDDTPTVSAGTLQWDVETVSISMDSEEENTLVRTQGDESVVLSDKVRQINFFSINDDPNLYIDEIQVVIQMEEESPLGRKYEIISTTTINMRNGG